MASAELRLTLPIDCELGKSCHIQNYVDHDPGPGFTDFSCGLLGYDGHKGTDFALASDMDMRDGVNVLAADDGTIIATRDGMTDQRANPADPRPEIVDRECGNGVVIDHGDGWQTQYCHLAQNSVSVTERQDVKAGDILGQVGLSGMTEFPHLHLSVRHNGNVVDPFLPEFAHRECVTANQNEKQLWETPIDYRASGWISAGFSANVPTLEAVQSGDADRPPPQKSTNLVLWAFAFGGQSGQIMLFEIDDPTGETLLRHEFQLTRTQAQLFRAAGLRAPLEGWEAGQYLGRYSLRSPDGVILDSGETKITFP